MSDFVNTVDVVGDEALTNSIIDKTVTELLDDKITTIHNYCLRNSHSLVKVNMPNATYIGNYNFQGCESLKEAYFPKVTSLGDSVFYGCAALDTIDLSSIIAVKGLTGTALVSASFPNATSIGSDAFWDCTKLTEVNAPNVTSIGKRAFSGCAVLEKADFPLATTLGDAAFANCTAVTSFDFPEVTSIGNKCFATCKNVTSINLPKITVVPASAFTYCYALKTLDFPLVAEIGNLAFSESALTNLILRNTSMVTLAASSALGTTGISKGKGYIYVPAALVDTYKADSVWSTYAAQFRALEDYTVDGTVTGELDTNYLGDTIVEDGLWFNLDLRGRTADNGDGGDHSLVDSVNGYECTVHNVAFDGENDGFVENGLKLKPITDFSSAAGFNQYVARTYATVELFNAKEFYGGDIPTDNTQEFEVTVEVTGNVWGNANVSGEKGCVVFAGQEPMPSMQFTADKTWNDSDYFCKSDGSTDYLIRYHLGCVNIDGTLIGHKNVFDYSQDHTYTITKSKDGKITTYIDGMRFLTSTGAPETAAEDFSHWLARSGQYKSYLGSASNGSLTTAPKIYSHVRVYKRALTEREVKNNYRFDVSKRSVSN